MAVAVKNFEYTVKTDGDLWYPLELEEFNLFGYEYQEDEEVTIMCNKICQSCGMPITANEQLGINKDGSINIDYCKYCYENGEFIDKVTMEEYIEMCSQFGSQAGMSNEEMREHCKQLFPTLKRWKVN